MVKPQQTQVLEVTQFRRYHAGQVVLIKLQVLQVPEVAQFGRNGAAQLVMVKPQALQGCEVAEFRRYRARKVVFPEVKGNDPPCLIGRHPVPVSDRGIGQPVGVVGPVGPIGSVVQGHEMGSVAIIQAER